MFATQYFAQWYFAGNYVVVTPTPVPVVIPTIYPFGLGLPIGTDGPPPTPAFGKCGSNPGILAIGTRGGNSTEGCGCP